LAQLCGEANMKLEPGRAALFLDRDGTLIYDLQYIADPHSVKPIPGAAEALQVFQRCGYLLIVVSNQSGIGRGLISVRQAQVVHYRFITVLRDAGVEIDDVYYCPHAPDAGCSCRKPSPRLVFEAAQRHGIDLKRSLLIGDQQTDLKTAKNAGVQGFLLQPRPSSGDATELEGTAAGDWDEAVKRAIAQPQHY
jgi:histidinol-phosphate phosphatase family protein